VNPDGTAEAVFIGDNDAIAGINKDNGIYKTMFWGFPFEALPTAGNHQETLDAFLNWCNPFQAFLPLVIR
jgi:hypothetical protein